jgi:hypothetical protein
MPGFIDSEDIIVALWTVAEHPPTFWAMPILIDLLQIVRY